MSTLKKVIPVLLLISLIFVWFFVFHKSPQVSKKQVLGANSNIELFVEPDSGTTPIINAINSASNTILIEVYLLSDKDVLASLENAKSRGVAVNIMLEKHPFGGGKVNDTTKKELEAHNIKVSWSSPDFALTHQKSIVIDQSEVLVLSQNLTTSSFKKNREYDILDKNPEDIKEVTNIFMSDWNRQSFAPSGTDLIDSPDNSRVALESLINNAVGELDMEAENIDDKQIISLLEEKAKTMPVKLITPTISQLSSNKKTLDELSANKVEVKTISSPYMHAKLILSDNSKAYVGSINFSTQSMDANRELGIVISDQAIIQRLISTFATDWTSATMYK